MVGGLQLIQITGNQRNYFVRIAENPMLTPNEYIRKLQREGSMKEKYGRAVMTVSEQMQEELEPLPEPLPDINDSMKDERDLGEEAEDEILKSTGKVDFTQDSEYIRLFDDDESEEFMESVYKKELGSNLETVDSGVAIGFYDSLPDTSSSEDKPRWFPERDLKKKDQHQVHP